LKLKKYFVKKIYYWFIDIEQADKEMVASASKKSLFLFKRNQIFDCLYFTVSVKLNENPVDKSDKETRRENLKQNIPIANKDEHSSDSDDNQTTKSKNHL
jgi:hypothetical protein